MILYTNKGQLRDLIFYCTKRKKNWKHFFPGIRSHRKLWNCFPFTQMIISGILDHSKNPPFSVVSWIKWQQQVDKRSSSETQRQIVGGGKVGTDEKNTVGKEKSTANRKVRLPFRLSLAPLWTLSAPGSPKMTSGVSEDLYFSWLHSSVVLVSYRIYTLTNDLLFLASLKSLRKWRLCSFLLLLSASSISYVVTHSTVFRRKSLLHIRFATHLRHYVWQFKNRTDPSSQINIFHTLKSRVFTQILPFSHAKAQCFNSSGIQEYNHHVWMNPTEKSKLFLFVTFKPISVK